MCALVTTELFDFASSVKVEYTDGEKKELNDAAEVVLEDQWLEEMYGAASTLQNEAWIEKISKAGKWVFDAAELRARLFKESAVTVKHIK